MKKTLFKSLYLGAVLTAMAVPAQAAGEQITEGNNIYIEDFTISPGETKTVQVMADNTIAFTQFQVYIRIPEGIGLSIDQKTTASALKKCKTDRWYYIPSQLPEEHNYYDEEVDEPELSDATVNYNFDAVANQYKYVCISMAQVPFWGNSGPVLNINFAASEDFAGGSFYIDNWKMVAQNGDYNQAGTEYGTEEIRVNVSVPQAATPLATVVAEGVNNEEYTIADDLHIVARSDKGGYLFVSNGNNNWMKIKAGTELYDAMANWDDIKGGTLTGVLSEAECNQTLTISALPEEGTDAVNATANAWNLAQNDPTSATYNFAPKVNEVILLTGYWFDGEFRGYSSNKGQSATANFGWCDTDNTMSNGTLYKDVLSVAQLKEPWSNNAPAKIAATDELAFQNYLIYPLAIEANNILTGVENLNAGKDIVEVQYVNAAGMVSSTPFKGVNMVVTRYADGSQRTTKVVK